MTMLGIFETEFALRFLAALKRIDAALVAATDELACWQERRATRVMLRSMDDHMLRDIGLTRLDAEIEAAKPFWRR